MTTITITISVDAGPEARVTVGGNGSQSTPIPYGPNDIGNVPYVPPFSDELVPLPEGAIPLPGDPQPVQVFRGAATAVANPDLCPIHRMPWKTVPAGVSKGSGKPYAEFRACPERDCNQRPR